MNKHDTSACPACAAAARIGLNPALCDVGLEEWRQKAQREARAQIIKEVRDQLLKEVKEQVLKELRDQADALPLLREAVQVIPETTANADLLSRIDTLLGGIKPRCRPMTPWQEEL
jgi:hypothetical protein